MYVQVSVNVPQVTGVFDYYLPEELSGQVLPGCLVEVPFGKQTVQGIVLECMLHTEVQETRPVIALLEEQPVLTGQQMELAAWLSENTLAPLAACLDLMLPPGLSKQADTLYHLNPQPFTQDPDELSPLQQRLIDLLVKRGDLRGRQLAAAFPHQSWKPAVLGLVRRGRVIARPVLPPPSVRPKLVRTVQLSAPPEAVEEYMQLPGRGAAVERRQAILRFLLQEPWPVAVSWAYASSGGSMQDLQKLAEDGMVALGESEVWRDPLENNPVEAGGIYVLTDAQQAAWEPIYAALSQDGETTKPFLLHGVTGSGKTEIYLRAVAECLRRGRQAIVLVPEIALTPQTLRRFTGRFPGQVGVIHSRLSPGEHYDTWRRARAGQLPVIVGPRSALFTPLPDVGLIVVDECHDDSYYQSEGLPYYHAVETAIACARLYGSVLVLGSATPSISIMHRAEQAGWNLVKLPQRIQAHIDVTNSPALPGNELPLPPVRIVDMREELKSGNRSMFSKALTQGLENVLAANQQAILFLNRRGSATYVFCRECGYTLRCPRCDLPLTFHVEAASTQPGYRASNAAPLRCHTCNYSRRMPEKCPECGSRQIRQYGAGTEKVEKEIQVLFPQARLLRWDAETTRKKGAHELLLSHFINHRADILIGTQMLAKGLDLPLVTLVGAVLADVGLNFPDFRASERTFQLLTQVAGRAGRSPLGGQVIFQTFQPEHPAIQSAARHDFEGYYRRELEERRRLGYPPFNRLARLEYRSLKAAEAEETAARMAKQVQYWIEQGGFSSSEIIGPVPCFFSRVGGYYRWQVILRSPDPLAILRSHPMGDFRVELDPPNLL